MTFRFLSVDKMIRGYPSDTGHLPVEIWQIIAGKMDFRDWGRAAASACRMFHTLQPGIHCHISAVKIKTNYLLDKICQDSVWGTDVVRCTPDSIELLKKAAQRMREATAILLDLGPHDYKLPIHELYCACIYIKRLQVLRELQIRGHHSHELAGWVRGSLSICLGQSCLQGHDASGTGPA